ncbi:MAG TPA: hypothetical protein VM688_03580 [Nocardioidaceae bacterium]|jgi:hypothetical protein|nr:hypothetical protein [Nocardioidaceae bacterium]
MSFIVEALPTLHDDPRIDAAAACATRSTCADGRGWKLTGAKGGDVHVLIASALALQTLRDLTPRNPALTGRPAVVI